MTTELARCNGTLLVADGDVVGLVERGGWLGTAVFVSVLVASIAGIGGGVLVVTVNALAGLVVLAIAAVGTAIAVALIRAKRRRATAPLSAPWLVFDRAAGVVRNGAGAKLCGLAEIKIERVFQVGSSSKALAVFCPRKIVVARGTPFGDEVDSIELALRRVLGQ